MKNDYLIEAITGDPLFRFNKNGKIEKKNQKTGKFESVKFHAPKKTYQKIHYKSKMLFVHRIIYRAFHGWLPFGLDINHLDGNPKNNRLENLEACSRGANLKHSYKELKRKANLRAAWEARGLL